MIHERDSYSPYCGFQMETAMSFMYIAYVYIPKGPFVRTQTQGALRGRFLQRRRANGIKLQ